MTPVTYVHDPFPDQILEAKYLKETCSRLLAGVMYCLVSKLSKPEAN